VIPIQEVDVHTDAKVSFRMHLVRPGSDGPFFTQIFVNDAQFEIPFSSSVQFHQQFDTAKEAFNHGLSWVRKYCVVHSYNISCINNPCNCELLRKPDQESVANQLGIYSPVQVNGA